MSYTRTVKFVAFSLLGLKIISKFDFLIFFSCFTLELEGFLLINLLIIIFLNNLSKTSAATVTL